MKSKLRILHVIGGGEFGGAEQHIINLLTSFPKDVVEATVVCFYDALFASTLREEGIPVIALTQYGRFDFRLYFGLQQIIRDYQPDIIHTHGVKANFLTRLASIGSQKIGVTTVHSNLRFDYQGTLTYLVASLMERSTRRFNTHYIAISRALQDILHHQGISKEQTSLIYNGIPLADFQKHELRESHRESLLLEWDLPQDAFVFGTVCRFVPVKGLPYLIQGFHDVAKEDPDDKHRYRLVLIGDGPERNSLEQLVHSLGLNERVRFTGFRKDVPDCLHALDTFVHSSLYEGMGYTIIEAMASRVPVIATNVGGVGEVVFADKTGILVKEASADELCNAMLRLASDSSLRNKLVRQANELVESTFTIEIMAKQTLALYRELMKQLEPL